MQVERKISRGREIVESMKFPDLEWIVPRVGREIKRIVLSNGLVVYSQSDRTLPLFQLDFRARGGRLHECKKCHRQSSIALSLLRTGGTERYSPEDFDEIIDFNGLTLQVESRLETSALQCNGLSEKLPIALELICELLTSPRLDESKLDIIKQQWREFLRRRNDEPQNIVAREFNHMLFGNDPQGWDDDWDTISSLDCDSLRLWHNMVWDPSRSYLAISGDFDEDNLADLLEKYLSKWQSRGIELPPIPNLVGQDKRGTYLIDRKGNQSSICMGFLGVDRYDKHLPALELGNYILGAGSFSSRLVDNIRTKEGLAYSVYSHIDLTTHRRGRVLVCAQTRTETTSRVLELVVEEMERLGRDVVSLEELEQASNSLKNSTFMAFSQVSDAVSALMQLEIIGWPSDYYETFLDKLSSVTREEVREAVRRVYKIEDLLTVIVGDESGLLNSCPSSADWQKYILT